MSLIQINTVIPKLDSLTDVNGFSNVPDNTIVTFKKVNGVFQPSDTAAEVSLTPGGGLIYDGLDRLGIEQSGSEPSIELNPIKFTGDVNSVVVSNVLDPILDQDAATKNYTDTGLALKADQSELLIATALPGIPVIDNITLALLSTLNLLEVDDSDRVSGMIDPVSGKIFGQSDNDKKPLIKYDDSRKKYYVEFDGVDDSISYPTYPVEEIGGVAGNTTTVFMLVNTYNVDLQSQFNWEQSGGSRFGVHIPFSDGNIYIDYGNATSGRLIVGGQEDLTGNVELWTIRINGTSSELFRGTETMTPVGSGAISSVLPSGVNGPFFIGAISDILYHCKMDLYAFLFYNVALNDDDLKQMFRYFSDEYQTKQDLRVRIFDYKELILEGDLGDPTQSINGSWSTDGDVFGITDSIINQDVIQIDGQGLSAGAVFKTLSATDWKYMYDFGGTLKLKVRMDATEGDDGGNFGIGCLLADSPVPAETTNRRYVLTYRLTAPYDKLTCSATGGLFIVTDVNGTDRYTVLEIQIPPGLGDGKLFVNGQEIGLLVPYDSGGSASEISWTSIATGATYKSYGANFGLIMYKESETKLLTGTPATSTRIEIPWGPRDYRIEVAESLTSVPRGVTLDVWARNNNRYLTFAQENDSNPKATFNGRKTREYFITEDTLLTGMQVSSDTPNIVFSHARGVELVQLGAFSFGRSRDSIVTIVAEHSGILTAGDFEWGFGSGGTGPGAQFSGWTCPASGGQIISGSLSCASNAGATVAEVEICLVKNGVAFDNTEYCVNKPNAVFVGKSYFLSPLDIELGDRISFKTTLDNTVGIVIGQVSLQILLLY